MWFVRVLCVPERAQFVGRTCAQRFFRGGLHRGKARDKALTGLMQACFRIFLQSGCNADCGKERFAQRIVRIAALLSSLAQPRRCKV